jgi:hypothetical protein
MAASAKSLQNIYKTNILNPGACGVNVGDASTWIADAELGEGGRPLLAAPRTDPGERNYRTWLLPQS